MTKSVWYCSECNMVVRPIDVTSEETHDVRAGGCGQSVVSLPLPERRKRDADFFICPNGDAAEWLYVSIGGKVVRVEAGAVRKMRDYIAALTHDFDPDKVLGPPIGPERLKEAKAILTQIEGGEVSIHVKFTVDLHTKEYRGDHSADVMIAHDADPDETIGHLVERLLSTPTGRSYRDVYTDWITIRRVKEQGEVSPS